MKTTLQPVEVLAMDDAFNLTNDEKRDFAMSLVTCESEEEVEQVLRQYELWDDESAWKSIGGDELGSNYSIIGNQQDGADKCLVEKLINSVDAVLVRECLSRGVDPSGTGAPESIEEAQKEYFGITNGKLSSISAAKRKQLAKVNIHLVASGSKDDPCYSIYDSGEGQAPDDFEKTLLSLIKGNKQKIPFVQGQFGMGGTGVFRYCSPEHRLQLIISKRNPVDSFNETKRGDELWGVTVTRRFRPEGDAKNSDYRYLSPKDEIISFSSDNLSLLPNTDGDTIKPYGQNVSNGTFIKLYEYQYRGKWSNRLKTEAQTWLTRRLGLLVPNIALPVFVSDTRHPKTSPRDMSGLTVRLEDDSRSKIESGYPSTSIFDVDGERLKCSIYAIKGKKGEKNKSGNKKQDPWETYKTGTNAGILFTINGQTHHIIKDTFFRRKGVGLTYIHENILVILDCSQIAPSKREDLFANSRDRIVESKFKDSLEDELIAFISEHSGLKELNQSRKRSSYEDDLADSKPIIEVLQQFIKQSHSFANLFGAGTRLNNPFDLRSVKPGDEYKGKRFPSYFKLKKFSEEKKKSCNINSDFRVFFETDVSNDYFDRDLENGSFTLLVDGKPHKGFRINLWNGHATLNAKLPEFAKEGEQFLYEAVVTDIAHTNPIENRFSILVECPRTDKPTPPPPPPPPPPSEIDGDDKRQRSGQTGIPETVPVYKKDADWDSLGFEDSTGVIVHPDGEGFIYYINMDNKYLLAYTQEKRNRKLDFEHFKDRFRYGMLFFALAMQQQDREADNDTRNETNSDDEVDVLERISRDSVALSMMLLPSIESLGNLAP